MVLALKHFRSFSHCYSIGKIPGFWSLDLLKKSNFQLLFYPFWIKYQKRECFYISIVVREHKDSFQAKNFHIFVTLLEGAHKLSSNFFSTFTFQLNKSIWQLSTFFWSQPEKALLNDIIEIIRKHYLVLYIIVSVAFYDDRDIKIGHSINCNFEKRIFALC